MIVFKNLLLISLFFVAAAQSAAANTFDKYNVTGEAFSFTQQDQAVFWKGGVVTLLDRGLSLNRFPPKAKFAEYEVSYMKWTPSYSNGQSIIYMHGFQSHAGWFYESAEKLAILGYTVYAFDRIGSGRSSRGVSVLPATETMPPEMLRGKGHINSWQGFTQTIKLLTKIAQTEHPENTINLWANSFAANLLTAYLMEYSPTDIASVVYTSPGFFSKLPLPFPVEELIGAAPGTYFPSTIPELDGDKGAYLFTSDPHYSRDIARDRLSLRTVTKEFYFNVVGVQNFHFEATAVAPQGLTQYKRFYLVVDGDPMMDTAQTVDYVTQYSENAVLKLYSGGVDHRHFLAFTEDADIVIDDIDLFLSGESVPGSEVLP
ncbi:alpha/beta fold hydrolase [Teredinibacter turnerae]|uniref:alpha/beta fold hydrolase n=1 Tax=Teredinibacter turnerae TaxID=2426 RepID=UPI000377F456|nr:alpha/beta fold hydrolase [Teredinibacter turnerae]